MSLFTCRWDTAPTLPDDHLITQEYTPTRRGIHVEVRVRAEHISETLIQDLDEYFRHLARADAYEINPEQAAEPPEFTTSYELIDPTLLPLRAFGVQVQGSHYTFSVSKGQMSTALVREINEDFLPASEGMLRTRVERVAAIEQPTMSNALDHYGARTLVAAA